jgi:hypothetical protein
MSEPQPRFEFRVWGSHLDKIRERLISLAKPGPPRESADTYILSRATDDANVKIRAGLLDIKVLIEQQGRLERWKPILKAAFPLDSRTIVEQVFPNLKLPPPEVERLSYSHGEFIRDLVQHNRSLVAVDVEKTRYGFTLDHYTAEFAQIRIAGGAQSETVEIESEDPAMVLRALAKLGLSSYPNVNYVRHLKLMMGVTPESAKHGS